MSIRGNRESPSCIPKKYNSMQVSFLVLSYLGISTILSIVTFMLVFKMKLVVDEPWFGLTILSTFTKGENWLLFFAVFDSTIFGMIVGIWVVYDHFFRGKYFCGEDVKHEGKTVLYYAIIVLALFGFAVLFGFFFMVIYFLGERSGASPWLSMTPIEGITQGENWTLFLTSIFVAFYITLLLLWITYKMWHDKNGLDFDDSLEGLPKRLGE